MSLSLPLLLLLEGFLFVVMFGGLSLLRREGLSSQFAVETVFLTLVCAGITWLTPVAIDPLFFLVLIYVISMRIRLLVDGGTLFARRKQFKTSNAFFNLATRLFPDRSCRAIILVNHAASLIQQGDFDKSTGMLNEIIEKAKEGGVGIKYEAAAYFNQGVIYQKKNQDSAAIIAFNKVIEVFPVSLYAKKAEIALTKLKSG